MDRYIQTDNGFTRNKVLSTAGAFSLALGLYGGAATQVLAAPVVMQADLGGTTADRYGDLYSVDLKDPPTTGSGWTSTDTTLSLIGTADREYNNMGWRDDDGYLYGLELTSTGNTSTIVNIDPSTGAVVSAFSPDLTAATGWSTTTRYDAGDVNNIDDLLYISTANTDLFIYDIVTNTMTEQAISGDLGYVADWAFNPDTGLLYGADTQGHFATLDPSTGIRTDSIQVMGSGEAFGAAWYDPNDGLMYFYRNQPTSTGVNIYSLNTAGVVQDRWGASLTDLNDGAYVPSAVPVPAAVWLFGSGLLGLVGIARRRKTA